MVAKCAGLPLTIIVLGGLLATKERVSEWCWWVDQVKGDVMHASTCALWYLHVCIWKRECSLPTAFKRVQAGTTYTLFLFRIPYQGVKALMEYPNLKSIPTHWKNPTGVLFPHRGVRYREHGVLGEQNVVSLTKCTWEVFVLPGALATITLVYFTPKHKVVFKIILLFLFKVVLYLNVLSCCR